MKYVYMAMAFVHLSFEKLIKVYKFFISVFFPPNINCFCLIDQITLH